MSKELPVFSVIVPHLNQPEGLEKCLESLANQNISRHAFEVIVVDNGSSHPVDSIVLRHPGTRLLHELTPGPGPARNYGARAAKGAILAFIDADCRADSDWLRVAKETLERSAPGTILGGDVRIISDRGNANSGIEAYERVFGFRFRLYVEQHGYSGTGNLIVRRTDFEKVGPFVGISFAEDVEWGGRARQQGFSFRYVPELIVYHPSRNSIRELRAKWDRHIGHELTAARQGAGWRMRWVTRAVAIMGSPLIDIFRPITSRQIHGASARIGAVGVLINIRLFRGARMLASLLRNREILWNRDQIPVPVWASQVRFPIATVSGRPTSITQNSLLVNYALRGLETCWLSDAKRWSHCYHLDGRDSPNESIRQSDIFYTLNVLLGLSRVAAVPESIDVRGILDLNASSLTKFAVNKYAFGMALWSSAELGIALPDAVIEAILLLLGDSRAWLWFTAQDLGMILAGVAARARSEPARWSAFAHELFRHLVERYHCTSGLFFNNVLHLRRRYTSFATHTYLTLACYQYGEAFGRQDAIDLANACVRKLIQLQGPNGEWPWFFDTRRGAVVDFYEVYSVHQYGMAPAFLEFAERHRVPKARDALNRSFDWVLGKNQLNRSMLVPELGLTIRSQYRKGELNTKSFRMLRSLSSIALSGESTLTDSHDVRLRLECRSYELGWMLWAFAGRSDVRELTNHPSFQNPNPADGRPAKSEEAPQALYGDGLSR